MVENADQDIDSLLQVAAREALAGHQYLKVVIKGRAQTGDVMSGDWNGEARGASHKYDDVIVDKNGKALIGNKFDGKLLRDN